MHHANLETPLPAVYHAASTARPMPGRSLFSDLFVALQPRSLLPGSGVSINSTRQVRQTSPAGASFLCGCEKASKQQDILCVTSNLPKVFQSGPLSSPPCYLPPFMFQSWVVVVTNASGLRIDSRIRVFIQSISVMSCCNKTSLLKTHPGYRPFSGKSKINQRCSTKAHFMETCSSEV